MSLNPVKETIHTRPTVKGAGVTLERAFGFGKENQLDPRSPVPDVWHHV